MEDINHQLQHLSENGLGKGSLTPDQQYSRISTAERLDVCVSEAILVMECVPEVLDLKREVWLDIDRHVQGETSLASSSSAIQPSLLSSDMEHRENFVVTHPINPPFYIPLVEIVRAPWTSDKTVDMVYKLMEDIGQAPVVLQKEIFNFVAARIQNACLQEAWWLIKDGVADVDDVERAMYEGLGMDYAFIGPLERLHLLSGGFERYMSQTSELYCSAQEPFREPERMGGHAAEVMERELESFARVSEVPDRRRWRDERLAELSKLKRQLDVKEEGT
ncbi:lambda-crystallin-like isoform X1 [Gigantopelta aegis]|uniref:lambda-crystallin-like isoform X1 n=1 Tax=Gigantopelta aegis TaxID=1735272 RepID=UPI001B88CB1B|nr:lambda-crystallin-like isoform X1 [Gigantopelta aegis]